MWMSGDSSISAAADRAAEYASQKDIRNAPLSAIDRLPETTLASGACERPGISHRGVETPRSSGPCASYRIHENGTNPLGEAHRGVDMPRSLDKLISP